MPLPQIPGPLVLLLGLFGGISLIIGLFTRYLAVLSSIEFLVISILSINMHGLIECIVKSVFLAGAFMPTTHGAGRLAVDRPICPRAH